MNLSSEPDRKYFEGFCIASNSLMQLRAGVCVSRPPVPRARDNEAPELPSRQLGDLG